MHRFLAAVVGTCAAAVGAATDRVVLKDGLVFAGKIDLKDERIEVAERHRVVSIGRTLLLNPEESLDVKPAISFKVPQPAPAKAPRPVTPLAGYASVDPFDEFGRRAVVIVNDSGKTAKHIQAIHAIFPTHVETDVVDGSFRSTTSLSLLPGPILRKILRRCIDSEKEQERIRVIEFLLEADRFEEAQQELVEFRRDKFSAGEVEKLSQKLKRRLADVLLGRLERWSAAGDAKRCLEIAAEVRKYAGPEQLAKLNPIVQAAEKTNADAATARRILDGSAPAVANHRRAADLTAAVKTVVAGVGPTTLHRMKPMLFLSERSETKPDELVAVAVSGWCAGPDLALPDVDRAADLWRAREHLSAAIDGDEIVFQDRLRRLAQPIVEGRPRLKSDVVAAMIAQLPGPATDRPTDAVSQVKTEGRRGGPVEYLVYLPPSYQRQRSWSAAIALHDQNADPQKEIAAWRGSASDFGVVVCCPVWKRDEKSVWRYTVEDHLRLEDVVVDLRRRFALDCDRLFLAGRGAGGDAAWDFAAGHGDEFAGLISLSGVPMKYAERYTTNLAALPIFSIHGGLNMHRTEAMNAEFAKICAKKGDAIHIVYPARGGESFAPDMPLAFDWMSRRQRPPFPAKVNAVSVRESDRRFSWLEIEEFRDGATLPPELLARNRFNPATLSGAVNDAGSIVVRTGNISALEVHLSPKLAPLDAHGFSLKVNNKTVLKGPVEPDLETMLRRLRRTGDNSRLITNVVSVKRP